jgi:two-component system, cell cycle sensor histidine kinase and response regulator CckA
MAMRVLIRFRAGRIANVNQAQPLLKMSSNSVSIRVDTDLPPGRGTILLVEDETFLRQVTCEILESAGYRVLQSRNAAEAISTFQEYKTIVRLLLTDVVLPGQNGRDLANDLRIVCPNLRIIFISGYPENAVTEHGIQEDGMFYLPKPFSLQALTRKVRQVLEEKETVTIEKTEMKGDCRTSD